MTGQLLANLYRINAHHRMYHLNYSNIQHWIICILKYLYLGCFFKPLILFQQSYHCRSLLFSSQKFTANYLGDDQTEWFVDVYPKGVWFQRCLTVYKPPGLEVLLHIHVYSNPLPFCHAYSLDQCVQIFSRFEVPPAR